MEDPVLAIRRKAVRVVLVYYIGFSTMKSTYVHMPQHSEGWDSVRHDWFVAVLISVVILWFLERFVLLRRLPNEVPHQDSNWPWLRAIRLRVALFFLAPLYLVGDIPDAPHANWRHRIVRFATLMCPIVAAFCMSSEFYRFYTFTFVPRSERLIGSLGYGMLLGGIALYVLGPSPIARVCGTSVLPRSPNVGVACVLAYMLVPLMPFALEYRWCYEFILRGDILRPHNISLYTPASYFDIYIFTPFSTIPALPFIAFGRWFANRNQPAVYVAYCMAFAAFALSLLSSLMIGIGLCVEHVTTVGTHLLPFLIFFLVYFASIVAMAIWAFYPPSPSKRTS